MSIPAVKGVEIGVGFASAELRGEEIRINLIKKKKTSFQSNNAGGTLGRIIRSRFGYKICCETNEFNLD